MGQRAAPAADAKRELSVVMESATSIKHGTGSGKRTGCSMCGFGIHMEKRPHRFDLLRERNEKEWKFWMYDIGWGHVLDYIGVEWETPVAEQMKIGEV